MKLRHKIALSIACLAVAGAVTSCSETDYMTFDQDYNGIYFKTDSVHYSFGIMPIETLSHTQDIPVQIMGAPAPYDRTFSIEILDNKEHVMPVEGVQYKIHAENIVVKADSIIGALPIELLRPGMEGDDENGYTRYELRIRLVADNNFTPTLSESNQNVVLTFDNAVEKPDWVGAVWAQNCGDWHPLKLIKLLEYFHTNLAEQAPTIYEKMVSEIGENWERVQYGWPTDYNYTIRKYILTPEYEYFQQHPEHGITDFPNPNVYN